jgi:phospholipid/cholesterol/gamma-HCH transport system ATP-binding protein
MLNEGRIRFAGTPNEILQSSDPVIQQFIRGLERPHDVLTGIPTHVQGERRCREELARLRQHQITFSVIILTVENLEEINEKVGHVVGQAVVKNFAGQVQHYLEITDFCYRYSLDKILVVLHNADIAEAKEFVSRLAGNLRANQVLSEEAHSGLEIMISAGFAEAEEDSQIKDVFAQAESKDSSYYKFYLS